MISFVFSVLLVLPSCSHKEVPNTNILNAIKKVAAVIHRGKVQIIIKYSRLSHDVVTCDVDRDLLTAYCLSSSGDEVDWLRVTF